MSAVKVVSPAEWKAARVSLLEKEKAHTRAKDALNAERRQLPIVKVDKCYKFTTTDDAGEEKTVSLLDLFDGRRQLIVYHFMFDPKDEAGCVGCSLAGDHIVALEHLHARNTSLVAVSRAPIAKIDAFKKRMGWTFPWVSSHGSEFNYDYNVTVDPEVKPAELNFRTADEMKAKGDRLPVPGEYPGISSFIRGDGKDIGEDGIVYHTYSAYARAGESYIGYFGWLDATLLGRQDKTGQRAPAFARRDEYTEDELKGIS